MAGRLVVVGAGQAAFALAAKLRMLKDTRPITVLGSEPVLPYQRPPLSKAYLLGKVGVAALRFRPPEYFDEHRIARIQGSVAAIDEHTVVILNKQLDPDFLFLMGQATAIIVEPKSADSNATKPVGTGPYKVVANDPLQLCLEAFDDYFGLRALLDEIDIWMLPELAERLESHLQLGRDSPELGTMRGESELESGCYFLLQDDRSGSLQDPALRQWLGQLLNPVALMGRVAPELQRGWTSALGLLPHWREALPAEEPKPALLPTRLVLACFNQHLEFNECANAMASLLAEQGIRLEVRTLDYGRWVSGVDEDVDLWLGTLNLEHEHAFAPYAWLQGTPLLRRVWGGQQALWQGLTQWRASGAEPGPRPLLAEVQRQGWFVPLFHHWLELESRVGVHGVRMTALGWFDFRSAWLRPEQGMAAAETGDGSHPDAGTLES